ncbi:MAG TPA: OmpA family protein [Alphaproteobacteria bacterium]|nr:OmpA family protein [Alphaproteobacteria bacterium]
MKKSAAWVAGVAGGMLASGLAAPVAAQPADQPGANTMEEIVVTARRREERLQSVPVAVTAFSQADITLNEIQTAEDLQRLVPSMYVGTPAGLRSSTVFNIRGQGAGFGNSPGVVAYLAEVPVSQAAGSGTGPGFYYDMDSVQVLKGPQGTLFGRNTTGGAVLFQPKRPTNDFEGFFQETLGSYDWVEESGAINVPVVTDKLMVRFAADIKNRDGYTIDYGPHYNGRDYDNVDYWAFRLSILARPTDNFENYLLIDSLYSRDNGTGTSVSDVNPKFPLATPVFNLGFFYPTIGSVFAAQQAQGARGTALYGDQYNKIVNYGISDIATWDILDDLTFKNIFSYHSYKATNRWDVSGIVLPLIQNITPNTWASDLGVYTEEPQIQGRSLGDRLNWTIGLYYEYDQPLGLWQQQTIEFLGLLPSNPLINPGDSTTKYQAAYAQATYDMSDISPVLEGFSVTAGYRYSWIWTSSWAAQYYPNHKCAQRSGFTVPNCTIAHSAPFSHGTYTFGGDYQITPHTLVYVTARSGFKQGGFNATAPAGEALFQPETVDDVEIGLKSDWELWGIKSRTNVAAFHSSYNNIQRSIAAYNPNGTVATLTENAAQATIEGLEFEGTFIPSKEVELQVAYSWNNSVYDKYFSPVQGDLTGNPFPDDPQTKLALTATYHFPIDPDWGDLSASVTWSYQSHVVWALDSAPLATIGSYSLYNFKVDWRNIMGRPFDIGFFMTNATNTLYRIGGDDTWFSTGTEAATYGEPRMWGFELRYRFGPGTENEAAPAEPAAAAPALPPPPAAPKSYLVFFDFDKSTLTSEGRNIVDQAAANAGPAHVTQITVTGHTDTVGSDAYNMRLSKRRAESVAAELEAKGI